MGMSTVIFQALLLVPLWAGGGRNDIAYLALTDGYWQVWVMSDDGSNRRQITRTLDDKACASWYPDGKMLLVNGTDGKVYRVDLIDGQESPIHISLQGFQDAVLSPDAKHFAFSLSTSGSVDDHDIWMANEDGTDVQKLTTMPWLQHEPAWSLDGRFIYFLSGNGGQTHDIWSVEISDRRTTQITANQLYHFDVTVGGHGSLAYSSNRTGNYEIWVRSASGKERQITKDPALDARPAWAPDGKSLVFESSRGGTIGIWRVNLENSELHRLTEIGIPSRFPVWRGNGQTP